jgi:hypothetical protein
MKLQIDETTLITIFSEESKKIVGTCLKRFDIPMEIKKTTGKDVILNEEELENLKSQLKNLLYESLRTLQTIIKMNGKYPIKLEIKK